MEVGHHEHIEGEMYVTEKRCTKTDCVEEGRSQLSISWQLGEEKSKQKNCEQNWRKGTCLVQNIQQEYEFQDFS